MKNKVPEEEFFPPPQARLKSAQEEVLDYVRQYEQAHFLKPTTCRFAGHLQMSANDEVP